MAILGNFEMEEPLLKLVDISKQRVKKKRKKKKKKFPFHVEALRNFKESRDYWDYIHNFLRWKSHPEGSSIMAYFQYMANIIYLIFTRILFYLMFWVRFTQV